MTRVYNCTAQNANTAVAVEALREQFPADGDAIRMIFAFYDCAHDDGLLFRVLRENFPNAAIVGGTTFNGFLSDKGLYDALSIGLLLIEDPGGDYGAASARLNGDPAGAVQDALQRALLSCNCAGLVPDLICIYQVPGSEEAVIEGLRDAIGEDCPIIGGSAGDNDFSWCGRQLGPDGSLDDGIVVGVLFPSTPMGFSIQSGYEPAEPNGIVTAVKQPDEQHEATSGREIISIDNEPAAAVYNRWNNGLIEPELSQGGSIYTKAVMHPIGVNMGQLDNVDVYLTAHPAEVVPPGHLLTLCKIDVGSHVYSMSGNLNRLVARAGLTVKRARRYLRGNQTPAGALLLCCAGYRAATTSRLPDVANAIAKELGAVPFITGFSFGEQGYLINRNVHCNLTIVAIVFGN